MKIEKLKDSINEYLEKKNKGKKIVSKKDVNIIMETIKNLDSGKIRVTEKINSKWTLNQWVKKQFYYLFMLQIKK